MVWQNCIVCKCWHPIYATHLNARECRVLERLVKRDSQIGEPHWFGRYPYVVDLMVLDEKRWELEREIERRAHEPQSET